ncbi:hypothetical protein COCNU_08G000950 [Cocos nucifera]|uniref:Uncharacterized protein n=1 Tax=Cocos nucifera TaxID=13894 RepID=A0A8K0N5V1_COCNU|nr:hypothetical protein COCNU_08G000950 [Cocos nucifera]
MLKDVGHHWWTGKPVMDGGCWVEVDGGDGGHSCAIKKDERIRAIFTFSCQALEVIRELQKHFPIKRSPMRLRLIVPEKNFSVLMDKLDGWDAHIVSKDESGNQQSVQDESHNALFVALYLVLYKEKLLAALFFLSNDGFFMSLGILWADGAQMLWL